MTPMYFKELPKKAVSQIKAGIRKGFKYTVAGRFLQKARVELPRKTKTGKISVVPHVFYRCAKCLELWKEKEVQVDHIDPVVPVDKPESEMTIGEYAYRVFKNECQVLCKPCHKEKSKKENKQRIDNKRKV